MKKKKIEKLLEDLVGEVNNYNSDEEENDDLLSEVSEKDIKKEKKKKKDKLEQEADRILQQYGKKDKTKEKKDDSALEEKNGIFKPKFGDYKRIFSKESPKKEWFHFRDEKGNYLGSVDEESYDEALKHADKFKNADHVVSHKDLINKVKNIVKIPKEKKEEDQEEQVKKLPPKTEEKVEPEKPEAEPEKPEAEPEKPEAKQEETTQKEIKVDRSKGESLSDILKRNKPIKDYEDPEHLFESLFESHKRLVHRIATGLKNNKKIPYSMSDEDIEEAGRKALYHTIHKFDENKARKYFQHSKESQHFEEYSPDFGFHIFLKSQIEHHLIDSAYKKADLPSSVAKHLSAEASKEKAKTVHSTPSNTYIEPEEVKPQQTKEKTEEKKTSRPKISF